MEISLSSKVLVFGFGVFNEPGHMVSGYYQESGIY
jgi:hypothetical protein